MKFEEALKSIKCSCENPKWELKTIKESGLSKENNLLPLKKVEVYTCVCGNFIRR